MPEPTLRHLVIPTSPNSITYRGRGFGGSTIREVERRQHGALLRQQLDQIRAEAEVLQEAQPSDQIPADSGLLLQITTEPGYVLEAAEVHALTTRGRGVRFGPQITLLNCMQLRGEDDLPYTRLALHVPFGGLTYLESKLREYTEGQIRRDNPPHAFFANLNRIAIAALEALWTDRESLPQDDAEYWWEFWVRRQPEDVWPSFQQVSRGLEIAFRGEPLRLPDHIVVLARARRSQLQSSFGLLNTLAEVRKARPCVLELTDLTIPEQHEWIADAVRRIQGPGLDAPAVCLLDTGVQRGHRLLEAILEPRDNQSVFPDGDGSDGWPGSGHGTPMAGLAAYGDLRLLLTSDQPWVQRHRLESVRLIDPTRPHDPDSYGSRTMQAILLPETVASQRKRIYSLAISAPGPDDGRPTSWSAAIDAAAFGSEEEGEPKRLVVVAGGNLSHHDANYAYPDDNHNTPIEDPAQAWNALTVGALTHRVSIHNANNESESGRTTAIAPAGALSPFSRTSWEWDQHWPIKPEIVMEGGNLARHPEHGPDQLESLELVSTSAEFALARPLTAINATSAATAQAARLGAQIQVEYANMWPETIRGLIVHSAQWNPAMLSDLNPHRAYNRRDRLRLVDLLRTYGFGEPNTARASFSSRSAVTLLREDHIRPYQGRAGTASLADCHIHALPWPKDLLREHLADTFRLKVTLSYFTAPNPSANNALGGSRYRYGGCLLRFRVRHKDETEQDFERRLGRDAEEEASVEDTLDGLPTDGGWALGSRLRGKYGSLVQDVWQGSGADLAQMDRVAVFPVKGWWASRIFPRGHPWHNCHERPIRYSLIVSIEADQDLPIYSTIQTMVSVEV